MAEDLIEFWQRYSITAPPFIHPDDRDAMYRILRHGNRWVEDDAVSFDSYINHRRFGDPDDNFLHLSLLPKPYAGDLCNADIVILLLNPGLDYCDYWAEHKRPDFRERLEQNLTQSFAGVDYPFSALDPQFCWYSGFMWWERKLRGVVQEIAKKQHSSVLSYIIIDNMS